MNTTNKIPYLSKKYIGALIKPRAKDANKGNFGHALLLVGNKGRMGAAVIAARACLRTGCGLLTVNIPQEERIILQVSIPEAMLQFRENGFTDIDNFSAVGIGSAMGTDKMATDLLKELFIKYKKNILLDADALIILSKQKALWNMLPTGTILTPHVKEFDRLFGISINKIERINKAIDLSKKYPWVIVLKDNETMVVDNGVAFFNKIGNVGLAKGGSGDALSGMITALLAQGYTPFNAAKIGVYLHSTAADIAVKKQSVESLLATDVIEKIGAAFKSVAHF